MRLEVEEQVVSSVLGFVDKAMESFPGIKIDKAGASKVPAWSLLRWKRFNGQDQFAGRPWKFEVVQVSTIQSRDVRFMKVVKRLEEYQSWASVAAVEPVGGPHQRLPLLTKEKSKAYIEILDISPIELTVRYDVHFSTLILYCFLAKSTSMCVKVSASEREKGTETILDMLV